MIVAVDVLLHKISSLLSVFEIVLSSQTFGNDWPHSGVETHSIDWHYVIEH